MDNSQLPLGWARLKLGDIIVASTERVMPEEAPGARYIGLEHIERDSHRVIGCGNTSGIASVKTRFRAGDLLYGRLRPNLNKVAIAPFDGICSTDIVVFRGNQAIDTGYLLEILGDRDFILYAQSRAKGINLPRVSLSAILAYTAPVPPISEQRRIVATLAARYEPIRLAKENLSAMEKMLKILPARLIEAGVRGKLTVSPMPQNQLGPQAEGQESLPPLQGPSDFPSAWEVMSVAEAGEIRAGRQRAPEHHQGPFMRPYLRVANVLEDKISTDDVMSMNFSPAEFESYKLEYGDILLNEGQSLELV